MGFFSLLFGGGRFTSTKKYEAELKRQKDEYERFNNFTTSELLANYYELEATVNSDLFKQTVKELKSEKKFKKSEEQGKIVAFEKLQKNKDLLWYFAKQKKNDFYKLEEWTVTFEDNFEGETLDRSKWITSYYYANSLAKGSYTNDWEKQTFTDNNITVQNGKATIATRKERARGKSWSPITGFTEKDFDYTSGLISSGESFRQKYGKFEAKIRFTGNFPVISAFWMLGEKNLPQIEIAKTNNKRGKTIMLGLQNFDATKRISRSLKVVDGARFRGKYFIYSLEWTKETLVWSINGTEVYRETKNIPDQELYLLLSTSVSASSSSIPCKLDIDWVRCFKRN